MAKANKSFGYTDAFPSRFRDLADEKGCTMEEMAQAFSTTRQTVRNWQNGETIPDAKSICYIASFFSVTTDYLLGLSDVKTPNIEVRAIADRTGLKEDAIIRLCVEKIPEGMKSPHLSAILLKMKIRQNWKVFSMQWGISIKRFMLIRQMDTAMKLIPGQL